MWKFASSKEGDLRLVYSMVRDAFLARATREEQRERLPSLVRVLFAEFISDAGYARLRGIKKKLCYMPPERNYSSIGGFFFVKRTLGKKRREPQLRKHHSCTARRK